MKISLKKADFEIMELSAVLNFIREISANYQPVLYSIRKEYRKRLGLPEETNDKWWDEITSEKLEDEGLRVELDDRSEKIGYKIREAQLQKIPYMLILGDKEVEAKNVGVRSRKDGDIGAMEFDEFVKKIKDEIKNLKN